MRGSFKQTFVCVFKKKKFKKKGVWSPFSVALSLTSPQDLFGCLHYRALTFLFLSHVSSSLTFSSPLFSSFPTFLTRSLLRLACRSPFIYHFLLLLFFLTPLHYLPLLSLYLCIILVKMVSRGVIVVVYSVLKGLLMVETCAVCNI